MDRMSRTFISIETESGMRTDVVYAEKRACTRKGLHVNAIVQPDGAAPIPARTVDISTTGVCLLVSNSVALGAMSLINFEFMMDGQVHPIEAIGEATQSVVGSDGVRIGFHFKRLSMSSMIAISRYIG